MEIPELIDQLALEGPRLAVAAERAGWDAPVPATDWTVRELVTHVGGVHRWAAEIVRTASSSLDNATGEAVGTGPPDAELLDWFRDGHAGLVAALSAAPDDLAAVTFLPAPSPRAFWARRQAHETAVHRADAEAAAGGSVPEYPADFAQDGIAELLTGFAARRSNAIAEHATVALAASDGPDWTVTIGGERTVAEAGTAENAALEVAGGSSELYLWLWNRPSGAKVCGDERIAQLWRDTVRVRWS